MLRSLLHTHFGFSSFHEGQEEAVQNLLAGFHTLVVKPTGAGKSLIFQLASLQLPGITIVISPLIALMKDQVDALAQRGIPATFINSAIPFAEQNKRLRNLAMGKYQLVYIAPERLRSASFMRILSQQQIGLLAVDEAHCISEWGHDFRPDYLFIAQARKMLGNPLTTALTATATPQIQEDIICQLGLPAETKRIVTGFNRSNLTFIVKKTTGIEAKFRVLDELIQCHKEGAIIIYTGTRRDAEDTAEFIRSVCQVKAEHYHAGLPTETRTKVQEDFLSGKLNIIAATNAFGMGIDRPDVRMVIHFSLPGSLEAYYQEVGRAGRDHAQANAVLFYDPHDRALQSLFIQRHILLTKNLCAVYQAIKDGCKVSVTLDELSSKTGLHPDQVKAHLSKLEHAGALKHMGDFGPRMSLQRGIWDSQEIQKAIKNNDLHIKHLQNQLDKMIFYAEAKSCRRQLILDHFGDVSPCTAIKCCDNCLSLNNENAVQKQDERPKLLFLKKPDRHNSGKTESAQSIIQLIIECVQSLPDKLPRSGAAKLLVGSHSERVRCYQRHPLYGSLDQYSRTGVMFYVDQLLETGDLIIGDTGFLKPGQPSAACRTPSCSSSADPFQPSSKSFGVPNINRVVELGEQGSSEAVPELIFALGSSNGNVRRLAASALGKIHDPNAVIPLMELLSHERKQQVRQYAVKALGTIGDRRAANLLDRIANDKNEMAYTQKSAKAALARLKKEHTMPDLEPGSAINQKSPSESLPHDGKIQAYINQPHPRSLAGPWHCGWALDFHSSFNGSDWNRSGVGELTFRLKYQGDLSVLSSLADYAVLLIKEHLELGRVDYILPIPPSNQREVDPVNAFSLELSNRIGIPVQSMLIKTRATLPQKEMKTLAQKRANIAGAFSLNENVKGKRFLVIDDLFDSGATLEEVTNLLMQSGAQQVCVLTLTRTIHSDT